MNELRSRGVEDVLLAVVDGPQGFREAILAVFPEATVQTCIVHLLRHRLDFVSFKDRKLVAAALKVINRAVDSVVAEAALTAFEAGPWGRNYAAIGQSWRRAWGEVVPFYTFHVDVGRLLYTTNAIEALNAKLRRAVRARDRFLTDEAALKLLFLVLNRAEKEWITPLREWAIDKAQLPFFSANASPGQWPDRVVQQTGHTRNLRQSELLHCRVFCYGYYQPMNRVPVPCGGMRSHTGTTTMFEMPNLLTLSSPTPLDTLDSDQLTELQRGLSVLGYPISLVDGLYGPNTKNAWAEFKTDVFPGNPTLVGPESVKILDTKASDISKNLGIPTTNESSTIAAVIRQCRLVGLDLKTQISYVLATTKWETAQTFRPVKEAFWKDEAWRKANLHYYPYYGRGYVQITWKRNYEKYGKILGLDLVNNPDLALNHPVALFIVVHGFQTGGFTGRKISDYINAGQTNFIDARRCINGTDRAAEIAALAQGYMTTL